MKYEYLKGSENDFDGAPDWASEVIESTSIYGHAFVDCFDYMCKYQSKDNPCDTGNIINPTLWKVVAKRRQITEPEWDGVGLPPVGCEFEFKAGNEWVYGNCLYSGSSILVYEAVNGNEHHLTIGLPCGYKFRPIRSEADKKRDAALLAMNIAVNEGESGVIGGVVAIYDAIAAGKIPGVKLED